MTASESANNVRLCGCTEVQWITARQNPLHVRLIFNKYVSTWPMHTGISNVLLVPVFCVPVDLGNKGRRITG